MPNQNDPTASARQALASADEMERKLGIKPKPSPEAEAGAESFLERLFPGLSERLAGESPETRREAAVSALKAQAESDPDSLFSMLGIDAIKDLFRKMADQTDLRPGVQTQPPAGANPATAGQATRALVGGALPPEMQE